jgi:integrase
MAGTIQKTGENTWLVRIYMGRVNGKTKHFNKTIHGSKKDAEKFRTAKLREKDLGQFVEPAALCMKDFLTDWLENIARPRVKEVTFDGYKNIVESYVFPAIGTERLCDLRPERIQKLYAALQRKGLSARTVRYTHSVLSSALSYAETLGMIFQNPCNKCQLPKKVQTEMKYFTPDQVRQFLGAAKDSKLFALFVLAIETGMRPGEYLALQWKDLDFENLSLSVRRTVKERKGGGFYFASPKTAKSARSLSISAELAEALKAHKKEQLEAKMRIRDVYRENGLVFPNEIGDPLLIGNLRKRYFDKIVEKAGLTKIRLYDLRHTSATMLLCEGEHPKVVAERLGHSSTNLTLDTYTHVLPNMQKQATSKMAKMMFGT